MELDEEELKLLRERLRQEGRDRLIAKVKALLRLINKPIGDIVLDNVLPYLPVKSLCRLRSVSARWNRHISAPLFAHSNTCTNRSISGVFFQHHESFGLAFAPFDRAAHAVPDPTLSFLPSDLLTLQSSSNGLLCLASPSSYYVCNPATAEWAALPLPALARGPIVAAALVFEPAVYNFRADYNLVLAFEITGAPGVYGFETFSSEAGAWWASSEVCPAESLVPNSGVSAGGAAWWRTSMQTVVGYDPAEDRVRVVPWPAGYDHEALWQLGEMAGRLCCATVTFYAVTVHALEPSDRWALLASFPVVLDSFPVPVARKKNKGKAAEADPNPILFDERPWPLRFQSGNLEVMLWVNQRVIGLDLASRGVREICIAGGAPPCWADYVSHINTLAPVFPPPPDDEVLSKAGSKEAEDVSPFSLR